jgi:hypothetical protein
VAQRDVARRRAMLRLATPGANACTTHRNAAPHRAPLHLALHRGATQRYEIEMRNWDERFCQWCGRRLPHRTLTTYCTAKCARHASRLRFAAQHKASHRSAPSRFVTHLSTSQRTAVHCTATPGFAPPHAALPLNTSQR